MTCFWISSILKYIIKHLVLKAKAQKVISSKLCKVANFHQNIHFIVFNTFVLDGFYYCLRTIEHSTLGLHLKIVSMLTVILLVYELVEIWWLCSYFLVKTESKQTSSNKITDVTTSSSMIGLRSKELAQKKDVKKVKVLDSVKMINKILEN